jgi:thiol-disulfide isomerase/thioredoxin
MSITQHRILVQDIHDFQEIIETNQKVIALVYASWCPFCVRFLPLFERASTSYGTDKPYFFFFQDDEEIVADEYSVNVVPSLLVFENGKLVKRLDGVLGIGLSEKQLNEFLVSLSL